MREGGVQWRAAESYSQGLPSVGRAAQRELPLPRKLIIFNPGRRKEGGPGRTQRKEERKKERRDGGARRERRDLEGRAGQGGKRG